jgi:hypothetical protein
VLLQLLGSSLSLSLFLYTFQLHAATAQSFDVDVSPTNDQGIALGPPVIKQWDE